MLTETQLKQREGLITSSVVAGAVRRSKRRSLLATYCSIKRLPYVRRAQQGLGLEVTDTGLDALGQSVHARRGDDFEPLVLNWGGDTLNCEVEPAPFVRHADGWSGDSCDALYTSRDTGEIYCAEAKTVSPHESEEWGKQMTDRIPVDYLVQCHWHMLHHPGVEICWVPFLGGYDFAYRLYKVERDAEYQRMLWEEAHAFYRQYVEPGVEPPVGPLDTEYLTQKWPKDNGKSMEPTEETDLLVEEICKWRERRDAAELRYHAAQNILRDQMQDYAMTECDRYKVSYRTAKDATKVDWEALAREAGVTEQQILEHTVTKAGARRMLVTGKGDLKKKKKVSK